MFSSVGQIVGLIEIEPAQSDAQLLAAIQIDGVCEAGDVDESLGDLFARLVGQPAAPSCQTSRTSTPPTSWPANRLELPAAGPPVNRVIGADLARLEADLADDLRRLRDKLAQPEIRTRAR